ncbi:MAG: hypothetical protein ACYCSN_08780 [Acidobacteriaceae bacterium]
MQQEERARAERDRDAAEELAARKHEARHEGLLPGIVAIGGWSIVTALVGLMGAAHRAYPTPAANATAAAIGSLMLLGAVGMLLLRRWGWALVLGASALSGSYFLFIAVRMGQFPGYLMAAIQMVFFLYLVRPEVRARMR